MNDIENKIQDYTDFNNLLKKSGIIYKNNKDKTLLAINNKSFKSIPNNVLNYLTNPKNKSILKSVLKNHIISNNKGNLPSIVDVNTLFIPKDKNIKNIIDKIAEKDKKRVPESIITPNPPLNSPLNPRNFITRQIINKRTKDLEEEKKDEGGFINIPNREEIPRQIGNVIPRMASNIGIGARLSLFNNI